MKVIKNVRSVRDFSRKAKKLGKTIGFVPTMGYLHEGHLSLVRHARKKCDIVVVSIFVNPIQFGPKEDFKKYPRDIKRDRKMLSSMGVDVLFAPTVKEVFKGDFSTTVEVKGLSDRLCGASRLGHFAGVTTIVSKLFNMVEPDVAFFGRKDFQQLVIIKKMVEDLNMGIDIVGLPTVREKDGLAKSSRNKYLSPAERRSAAGLNKSLRLAGNLVKRGVKDSRKLIGEMKRLISTYRPKIVIDYIAVCDPKTLEHKKTVAGSTLIALAAYIGRARLIDNILVGGKK